MAKADCLPFCKLFKGTPPDTFPLDKEDFVDHFREESLEKVESFLGAKHMVIGMLGIKSNGSLREQ